MKTASEIPETLDKLIARFNDEEDGLSLIELLWMASELIRREAKLKAQLYDAEETLASVLEDMEHYKENGCIPTEDEINQVRNTLKALVLLRIAEAGK